MVLSRQKGSISSEINALELTLPAEKTKEIIATNVANKASILMFFVMKALHGN